MSGLYVFPTEGISLTFSRKSPVRDAASIRPTIVPSTAKYISILAVFNITTRLG